MPDLSLPESLSQNGSPNGLTVGILLAIGLLLLAHPLYLYPHLGQTPFAVYVTDSQTEPPADETVIAYSTLPPEAQQAIDAARRGESHRLWTGEDNQAIDTLERYQYVRDGETYYQYQIGHIDRVTYAMPVRGLLTTIGAILVVVGVLFHRTRQWRPLTPARSLWFPVGTAIALAGTQVYDVMHLGVGNALPLPNNITALLPLLVLFFTVGSLARYRGKTVLFWAVGLGAVLLTVYSVYIHLLSALPLGDTSPFVATARFVLFLGLVFSVAAAPWYWLGYELTAANTSGTY